MDKARVIDDGDDRIVVFPPGNLESIEEVRLQPQSDRSLLVIPIAVHERSDEIVPCDY